MIIRHLFPFINLKGSYSSLSPRTANVHQLRALYLQGFLHPCFYSERRGQLEIWVSEHNRPPRRQADKHRPHLKSAGAQPRCRLTASFNTALTKPEFMIRPNVSVLTLLTSADSRLSFKPQLSSLSETCKNKTDCTEPEKQSLDIWPHCTYKGSSDAKFYGG